MQSLRVSCRGELADTISMSIEPLAARVKSRTWPASGASLFEKSKRPANPSSAALQFLEELLRIGFVGEGSTRAEQGLEHRLSVGRPADALERYREMILDVRVARCCKIGRAEVCEGLVGFTLRQQDPTQGIVNLGSRGIGGESALGQFSSFRQIILSLVQPSEVVQRGRIGRVLGEKARIFGDRCVVFLLLQIKGPQGRADGKVLRIGLQSGGKHPLGLLETVNTTIQVKERKRDVIV